MLPKLFNLLERSAQPSLRRLCNGQDCTAVGAYPHGEKITFEMKVPRVLGASAVVLRLRPDGEAEKDLPLEFVTLCGNTELYRITLDTAELCSSDGGLFFYEFLFLRGLDTLFTDSLDNVEFLLAKETQTPFRLLIYRADFHAPEWFSGGTMYHIFVDRFCRGEGKVSLRPGKELDPDWQNGIPQFAPKPGDPLKNNIFFGGNLWGVIERLEELAALGVTVLYLSPIFEAASNHRYDTADYEKVDALLGGDAAFDALIREAHKRGMRVILDGVFNHTGDDSRYFNRAGNYPEQGAYQSPSSPFAPWYSFREFPDDYECWWGIEIMPRLNHASEACRTYFTGKDGIIARWLQRGADGWRLDVADELSDEFLDSLRETAKTVSNGEAIIIGEVWENAADKISYGSRRRYLRGRQLDSVMNYPFRNAVLALLQRGDTEFFVHTLNEIYASYPRTVSDSLMNLLGTHDTERILTLLGDPEGGFGESNATLAKKRLSAADRARAVRLLKIASVLQYTVYGVPSLYYGDEVGLEGYHDPFCRLPYPYGREDQELLRHYRMLGALRKKHPALHGGDFRFLCHRPGFFLYERKKENDRVLIALNLTAEPISLSLPAGSWIDLLSARVLSAPYLIPAGSCMLLVER